LGSLKGPGVDDGKLWEFNYMLSIGEFANAGLTVEGFVDPTFRTLF